MSLSIKKLIAALMFPALLLFGAGCGAGNNAGNDAGRDRLPEKITV